MAGMFSHHTGREEPNESAAGDRVFTAVAGPDPEQLLASGNRFALAPGNYTAVFRLRIPHAECGPIARLDVMGDHGLRRLGGLTVLPSRVPVSGDWIDFEVPFVVDDGGFSARRLSETVECQVYTFGTATVSFDRVSLLRSR